MLHVGIIGTGNIARGQHIPGWKENPSARIVAVCDVNRELAEKTAAEHGIAHVFTDYRELLEVKGLDAVDICTPNRMHTPIVLAALASGRHVLCEKPLAVTPSEIEEMILAAKSAGRLLMTAQHHRFRGISQAIKRWVDDGHLGKVYYTRAWAIRRNLLPPMTGFIRRELSGGGPCMDIGVHVLDLAMWLMGFPEPVSVTGSAAAHLAKTESMPGAWGEWDRKRFDVEDFACGLVRFSNGAMLSLESSWLAHIPQDEEFSCMLLGTKAGVSWPGGAVATVSNRVLVDAYLKPLPAGAPHSAEIWAFYDAVVNGKPSPVPPEESLKAIKILDGIYRSQGEGREVLV